MAGNYERLVAELKQNGEMSMKEGKSPLSFEGYRFIAKTAISQPRDYMLGSFRKMYPDQSEDHHDRRRIGDLTYMTVYDLMSSSMNN